MICAKMYTVEIYFKAVLLVSKFSRVGVFMCDWPSALSEKNCVHAVNKPKLNR